MCSMVLFWIQYFLLSLCNLANSAITQVSREAKSRNAKKSLTRNLLRVQVKESLLNKNNCEFDLQFSTAAGLRTAIRESYLLGPTSSENGETEGLF